MKKHILISGIVCILLLLAACASGVSVPAVTPTQSPAAAPNHTPEPPPTPVQTLQKTTVSKNGTVMVRGGDTLERDIIPQLCQIFSLTEKQVKDELANAQSRLVSDELTGFWRMEGMIVPGSYDVTNESLEEYVNIWIECAEKRYDALRAGSSTVNGLQAWEQLTLASIAEWECIGSDFKKQTVSVFLNRLRDDAKLQSCATVEYAIGYQRPYLTMNDIEIDSAYNTYKKRGLPPGPICAADGKSLSAAIEEPVDDSLYFFFYDYPQATMQFFSEYSAFKKEANISKNQFADTFEIGKNDIIDKRSFFAQ